MRLVAFSWSGELSTGKNVFTFTVLLLLLQLYYYFTHTNCQMYESQIVATDQMEWYSSSPRWNQSDEQEMHQLQQSWYSSTAPLHSARLTRSVFLAQALDQHSTQAFSASRHDNTTAHKPRDKIHTPVSSTMKMLKFHTEYVKCTSSNFRLEFMSTASLSVLTVISLMRLPWTRCLSASELSVSCNSQGNSW